MRPVPLNRIPVRAETFLVRIPILSHDGRNPIGMPKGQRASPLLMNTGHLNEHYGNLVTYFRLKGLVPPSSKRQ